MSHASRGNAPRRLRTPLLPTRLGPLASTLRDVLGCLGVIVAAVLISLLCVLISHEFPQLAEISR